MPLLKLYRGDTRDFNQIKNSGGFTPQALLKRHQGGFDGFLACPNKVQGALACSCPGMSDSALWRAAQETFIKLVQKPGDVQQHVIFNNTGAISFAKLEGEAYERDHLYQVTIPDYTELDGAAMWRHIFHTQPGKISVMDSRIKFIIDNPSFTQATFLGVVPHGGVEITSISPIPAKLITCLR
jgi:hypothetical protein